MRSLPRILGLVVLAAAASAARADDLAARVIVLANQDDPESIRVADSYAQERHVPEANIIALPMPRTETITWPEFVRTIWEPLRSELVHRQWIDAIAMNEADAVGRTKYAVFSHHISYLVVCRGVPLRIMHDPELYAPALPFTNRSQYRTNAGAVDSELALLAYQARPLTPPIDQSLVMTPSEPSPAYAINAFIPNPLFGNDHPSAAEAAQVVKVSRLDGPTVEETLALVDHALTAEQTGLLGRAYVDIEGKISVGDQWLEAAAQRLEELGFDTDVDRARTTIPATARFDAPVLYFGWYAPQVNGPFDLPGFRFPPGAVALHIHSYSAATLHSAGANWVGPLVARGVTATVGNVFEPFLGLTHHPDMLLRALTRGDTFGDAAFYAVPALSWQAIAIGDPLYRPFAVSFDQQWRDRARLPARLAGYAVLRKMNLLDAAGKTDEATELARQAQRVRPSFAVGIALAQRLQSAGENAAAAQALGFVPLLGSYRADEWALARDGAQILAAGGRPAEAETVYKNIFRNGRVPRELRLAWLPEASAVALAAKDGAQAENWQRELNEINAAMLTEKQ